MDTSARAPQRARPAGRWKSCRGDARSGRGLGCEDGCPQHRASGARAPCARRRRSLLRSPRRNCLTRSRAHHEVAAQHCVLVPAAGGALLARGCSPVRRHLDDACAREQDVAVFVQVRVLLHAAHGADVRGSPRRAAWCAVPLGLLGSRAPRRRIRCAQHFSWFTSIVLRRALAPEARNAPRAIARTLASPRTMSSAFPRAQAALVRLLRRDARLPGQPLCDRPV